MNELTIEQKAQRYEEALERAKKWYNAPNVDKIPTYGNRVIEEMFPELKESKDERIRKELISFFTERAKYTEDSTFNGLSSKEIIAWLEKQESVEWSEEDTKMFVNIKACLRNANKDYSAELTWLKSLKQKTKE